MPSELARHWTLDPGTTFLNHGSFGAAPRAVLQAQRDWRDRMEREPVAFFNCELEPALDASRSALAAFVGAEPDDVAFVHNATTGINAVLRSLVFESGDELLTTDHAYNAAANALRFVAERAGARVVVIPIPFPGTTPEAVLDAIVAALTPRTRLALIDHVTSPTAVVLPIERIVAELQARGVDVLVDGAHAPGMLPLDIASIGAAYYAGNCHKWLCAPKGSGFLHVRPDRQAAIRPLAISHGANSSRTDRSRFRLEFDWVGTDDVSPYLAVSETIAFGEALVPGGWPALMARNHELALTARNLVCEALGVVDHPVPDAMLGAMASVPFPEEQQGIRPEQLYDDSVHRALIGRGIQVAVSAWPPRGDRPWRRLVRVSAATYNAVDDMELLASALRDMRPL